MEYINKVVKIRLNQDNRNLVIDKTHKERMPKIKLSEMYETNPKLFKKGKGMYEPKNNLKNLIYGYIEDYINIITMECFKDTGCNYLHFMPGESLSAFREIEDERFSVDVLRKEAYNVKIGNHVLDVRTHISEHLMPQYRLFMDKVFGSDNLKELNREPRNLQKTVMEKKSEICVFVEIYSQNGNYKDNFIGHIGFSIDAKYFIENFDTIDMFDLVEDEYELKRMLAKLHLMSPSTYERYLYKQFTEENWEVEFNDKKKEMNIYMNEQIGVTIFNNSIDTINRFHKRA